MDVLQEIQQFLPCPTPQGWIDAALENRDILLIDHAHCEKKAASTAMNLMFRYVDNIDLLNKMSRLAREELIHFEQVLGLMRERGVIYDHMTPARYAQGLRRHIRNHEPAKLVDTLIIGAIIEARSCERFAAIEPYLEESDPALAKYYHSLLKAEGRHYQDYLKLAQDAAAEDITERVEFFLAAERELIESDDDEFRFHSGVPKQSSC
ncbi:tRNA-(ms[2]io[6]A)-hydroxylase [Motiliproteus coralliicola]|uniref:tRNA-(Ms[2]io[6]A)-hydroxylase n=1 Tax=Motiliproteus coralliicola TaxID=2283196 RepID=A0A369WV74_9GAMM|nr:tRNA-(ms[2]io[6]A)-hydroxylase [Motiliproteus coralliicola]RDE24436.1 tRNA-(ms[2]io[6]A)-hydroxylase [Motiliproteus coralliicola]